MDIVGYADRFSVRQGEMIRFMISCSSPEYRAEIVRLLHGDTNPAGPGLKEETITTEIGRNYPGRVQEIHLGSYVVVPADTSLADTTSVSLQMWVFPTTPRKGRQGLLSCWHGEGGFSLFLAETGELAFTIAGDGKSHEIRSGAPLRKSAWYFVAAAYDRAEGRIRLHQIPVDEWPADSSRRFVEKTIGSCNFGAVRAPLLLAAFSADPEVSAPSVRNHFNGKLDRPRLLAEALSHDQIERLRQGADPATLGADVIATWDLGHKPATSRAHDTGPHGMHGRIVNVPARAVTGYNWNGTASDFKQCPEHYGAIHFHDDDLEDAGWEVDFSFEPPSDLRSGVYAAKLTAGKSIDYVPFFVRPADNSKCADILFLAPTLSYMAYGNEHLPSRDARREAALGLSLEELIDLGSPYERAVLRYMLGNNLHSLYDFHTDGSGVAYTTRLRPIVNFRPLYNKPLFHFKAPHQFNEDLYIIDWMNEKNFNFDCATDEDLHLEGRGLLDNYRVVVTGSHPEYWTEAMYSTLESYLKAGGRVMYLGGNGFYWVTTIDPERPHVVEVRRQAGMRTWEADPGELHHSTTGELGGLWRHRGKPPQRVLGVGTISAGSEPARPYRRQPDSYDARASFIFEGIGEKELIGDFGLHLGGAAGWELDRVDEKLGTPHHSLVLASSFGHSDDYQLAVEELWESSPNAGGRQRPDIRADMVFFEYTNGGAAFSVGSISYCGSLSYNNYDNNISRITENVLRAFSASELPIPKGNKHELR